MSENLAFVHDVLNTIYYNDAHDDLFWTVSDDTIKFSIMCSDVFWWATADTEEVNEDSLPLLKQSYKDVKEASGESFYGSSLYCARRRMLRPQRPYLDRIGNTQVRALFEAAGPERNPEHEEMWHAWKEEK